MWLQHFRQLISYLRSEQAEPHLADLGPGGPVFQEFLQIAWPLHHLTGDSAVDRDLLARDVLQDSIVSCRRASDIVLWLQSVNRYDDVQMGMRRPTPPHRPESTRHHLHPTSSTTSYPNHQF